MKIGYPCINRSIDCTANSTFRLASYSKEKLIEKVSSNLKCLKRLLNWNVEKGLLFFRIGSPLIPFASHPICKFNWQKYFKKEFQEIGQFIKNNDIRISMHPDQFTLLNSPKKDVTQRSIAELKYHVDVLDSMKLKKDAKVQIHVGGVYNEKPKAMARFVERYKKLDKKIKRRLVIENDDRCYSVKDCLEINKKTKIPIILDTLHHKCLNNKEEVLTMLKQTAKTWRAQDGIPMIDYSNQAIGERKGKHTEHIHAKKFERFLRKTKKLDFDVMLEIKDKEKSALKALKVLDEL